MTGASAVELRQGVIDALPDDTSTHGAAPDLGRVYLPNSHQKALQPDVMVVSGGRGTGKSFWYAALQERSHRELLGQLAPNVQLNAATQVATGFGEAKSLDAYPTRDVLEKLLDDGADPRMVWRTVIVQCVSCAGESVGLPGTWSEKVAYVKANPELVDRLLARHDAALAANGTWMIIIFDALDRSAADWRRMHALIRGLLQAALDLRPYRRLRAKCFLRSDQLDETQVANFPDASKVLASRVELSWPRAELYGLFWQHLVNADRCGSAFRELIAKASGETWTAVDIAGRSVWRLPRALHHDEERQRSALHALTGEWMGTNAKRGYPFTWIPSHLADGQGSASPRSFVAALREAALDTASRYPNNSTALHYESIKRGVQAASTIRVRELREDYPWVDDLMVPLEGLVVPCPFEQLSARWEAEGALAKIETRVQQREERLPPAHLTDGSTGVRRDLESLGVFVPMQDGRTNIPDVFRVGYGLGRRGGVRPVRSGVQE